MSLTHTSLASLFSDIADAIRAKTGSNALIVADEFPDAIALISSRRTNDVTFYDYDGTQVASYTAAEFANLTELPANPSHTGLTAQGWNWTLSDAKTYVSTYGSINIGQNYTTTSGATEIDISLTAPNLSPYLIITITKPVEVDWGDGSDPYTITLEGQQAVSHTYSAAGDYTITLTSNSSAFTFTSNITSYAGVLSYKNTPNKSSLYSSTIKAIRLADNAAIGTAAFAQCNQMRYITIPQGVTNIGEAAFVDCANLEGIILPNTVTELKSNAFSNCSSLNAIVLPKTVTKIRSEAFSNCTSLQDLILPSSVDTLEGSAFMGCASLEKIALPSSITTLGSNVFQNCIKLKEVTNSSATTSVPNSAFYSCKNLVSATIPSSVTTITSSAFYNCTSLQSITIPSNVATIGASAFYGCQTLSSIHFLPATPPTVANSNAFNSLPTNCIIYVPTGKLSAYTSATNYPSSLTYTYVEE